MIKSIKLKNFRQHTDTVIEFVNGINTIVGANNAGKSTIPEAIEFALYGAKALRDTGNSWITDGKSSGSVVLSFDEYKVGRDAVAAKVFKGSEPVADYKANVTKYVTQITGVTHAGFRLGHYVRQKELAAFSALRPGKRQETIEKMLKINAIDLVLTKLKTEIDSNEVKLKALLSAAQDADKLSDELVEAQIERAALVPIIVDEEPVNNLRKLLSDKRELLATYKAQSEELERLKQALINYDMVINEYDKAKMAYTAFEPVEGSLDDLNKKLKELQVSEVLKAKMSVIQAELEKPLEVYGPVTPPIEPLMEKSAISAAEQNLATVKRLRGLTVCPTCLTEIADVDKLISSLEDTLSRAKTNGKAAIDKYTSDKIEYDRLDRLYQAYIVEFNRRNKLSASFVEVEFSEVQKQQVENEIKVLVDSNTKYVKLKHDLELATQKKESLEQAKLRLEELEKIFCSSTLDKTAEEVELLGFDLNMANEVLKEQKSLAIKTLTNIARLDGRIQELQKAVETANTLRLTITEVADSLAKTKHEYEVFQKFKKYLTAKIRPLIASVAEALFHKVTKNRYSSFQLGSDYEILINTHQGYVRRLNTISGSENDLANLCLRLAIATLRSNKLVGNLGFIILDEISSSFDEDRTKQTLEGLLELKDIIPQIINITHKPVEMKFANRLITVKEVNNRATIQY